MDDVRQFAAAAHGRQRYGELPYTVHLEAVEAVLVRFGISDPELLAAAWLHDTVEDTGASLDEIRIRFGARVAALVHAVTDEAGASRKERKARTYAKTRALPEAVLLKLADRIANVEHSARARPDLFAMYRDEHPAFTAALRRPGEHDPLWEHLEQLFDAESQRND